MKAAVKRTEPKSGKRRPSAAELLLPVHLAELGLSCLPEFVFAPPRRWRLDFLSSFRDEHLLGIEIDGGVFIQGRHTRGTGFVKDCEKLNECAIRGISVLRFTPQQVESGEAKETIRRWRDAR